MRIKINIIAIFATLILMQIACKKNEFVVTDRTFLNGEALLKIGYFPAYTAQPFTQLYVNNSRISSIITAPYAYPGGGFNMGGSSNGDYLRVTPGSVTVEGVNNIIGTDIVLRKIFSYTGNLDANKRYTLFVTDTLTSTATFLIEDNAPSVDSGFVAVNFVNAMPNVQSVDVYRGTNATTATIWLPNVIFKTASGFQVLPAPNTDSIFIRPTGALATTVPIARRAFILGNQRIFTMLCRGYNGSTIVSLAPNVSMIVNQ